MIEVQGLAKRFRASGGRSQGAARDPRQQDGWFHAVREVGFHCAPGEVLGLLGPNGAGKTTTLRLLSTALKPDAGSIRADGVDLLQDPLTARKHIGFLSGSTGLYGRLSARENVEYFGRLHGLRPARLKRRCDELFELLGMQSCAHLRADQLSTGMKQKCSIARTVVHEPRIVVLDEPTTGLDVMSAKVLLDFIAGYKALGVPLIFSTHHLHEVEQVCDRVCIINHGRTVFHDSVDALRRQGGGLGGGQGGSLYAGFLDVVNGAS